MSHFPAGTVALLVLVPLAVAGIAFMAFMARRALRQTWQIPAEWTGEHEPSR